MYSVLTDTDLIKQSYHNLYNQHEKKQHYVVKLPCHQDSIEVLRAEDTYIVCPTCGKKYLLTHSAVRNKLYGEH